MRSKIKIGLNFGAMIFGTFFLGIFFPGQMVAQEYSQLMTALKDKMECQTEYEITVEQKIYYDGVEARDERIRTHTMGKNGRLFAEAPQYKILQNEKAYLLINDEQEIIFVRRQEEALEVAAAMGANFAQWEESLNQYVENADSIVSLPDAESHLFVVYHSQGGGAKARVKFDKQSGLLRWMEVTYTTATKENIRMEIFYTYNFSPVFSKGLFDENRFVNFAEAEPKGKMAYRDYRVIVQ